MLLITIFLATLFCFSSINCEDEICDLSDEKCLTKSCNMRWTEFITGRLSTGSSDPLHVDLVVAHLPTIEYKMINANLTGIKYCRLNTIRFLENTKKMLYHIECPHLVSESEFVIKGKFGPVHVDGAGTAKIDFYNYDFIFNADLEKYTNENGEGHIQVKKYKLDIDARGKVNYEFKGLFDHNEKLSKAAHKFANDHWRFVDKLIRKPAMEAYMEKYLKNIKTYLRNVPLDIMFPTPKTIMTLTKLY